MHESRKKLLEEVENEINCETSLCSDKRSLYIDCLKSVKEIEKWNEKDGFSIILESGKAKVTIDEVSITMTPFKWCHISDQDFLTNYSRIFYNKLPRIRERLNSWNELYRTIYV